MPIIRILKPERYVKVPDAEYRILELLHKHKSELHGPAIARASSGAISVGSVYKLLKRLEERELVKKREGEFTVADLAVKRVLYQIGDDVEFPPLGTYKGKL